MCWILETLIQNGWEISTSCVTMVNSGYDAGSFFLKKSSSPALHNAQVAAVVIDEHSGKKFTETLLLTPLRQELVHYSIT